jgi:hypothetical protein
MNEYPQLAGVVYQMCAAYDAYMPELNPDTAKAWGAAFEAHKLEPADLQAAVKKIFTERITTDRGERYRVAVADIVAVARNIRRERSERESADEQQARLDAQDARIEALAFEQPALAIEPSERRYEDPANAGAKFTRCPVCSVGPGLPCRNPYTGEIKLGFHPARDELAAENAHAKRTPLRKPDPLEQTCPICESGAGEKCQTGGLPMWAVHPERIA